MLNATGNGVLQNRDSSTSHPARFALAVSEEVKDLTLQALKTAAEITDRRCPIPDPLGDLHLRSSPYLRRTQQGGLPKAQRIA